MTTLPLELSTRSVAVPPERARSLRLLNAVMGVVFALFFLRKGRVMPLIVAHSLLDIAAFVGYTLLPERWLTWL